MSMNSLNWFMETFPFARIETFFKEGKSISTEICLSTCCLKNGVIDYKKVSPLLTLNFNFETNEITRTFSGSGTKVDVNKVYDILLKDGRELTDFLYSRIVKYMRIKSQNVGKNGPIYENIFNKYKEELKYIEEHGGYIC